MWNTMGLASKTRRPVVTKAINGITELAAVHALLGHKLTGLAMLALGDTIGLLVLTSRALNTMCC